MNEITLWIKKCVFSFFLLPEVSVGSRVGIVLIHALQIIPHVAEGPWNEVLTVIGKAHSYLHGKGMARVHSDIRVGSRYGSFLLRFEEVLWLTCNQPLESTSGSRLRAKSTQCGIFLLRIE